MRYIPPAERLFEKIRDLLESDRELKREFYQRWKIDDSKETNSLEPTILKNYGGYKVKRQAIESVEINPEDLVLDIGPACGAEMFMLSELYDRIIVAEPDRESCELLRAVSEQYNTEDGRKASGIVSVYRIGIITPAIMKISQNPHGGAIWGESYDIAGARDINEVFRGGKFADRVFCNEITHPIIKLLGWKADLLISRLTEYVTDSGLITYSDRIDDLLLVKGVSGVEITPIKAFLKKKFDKLGFETEFMLTEPAEDPSGLGNKYDRFLITNARAKR